MDSLFFVAKDGEEFTYSRLIHDLNSCTQVPHYCKLLKTYDIFKTILSSIVHGIDIVLLDSDFSELELKKLAIDLDKVNKYKNVSKKQIENKAELISLIKQARDWRVSLYTSGTTGIPKKITHRLDNLTRLARISEKHANDVWAYAYNPTHIAGIQVFFQSILNGNGMIDVFKLSSDDVMKRINGYNITNISATPTFYRMLLPLCSEYPSVRRITSGGESFDPHLSGHLEKAFPNAKLRNIYASTEAGSVLESNNDKFVITCPDQCKIVDNRLFIHMSLLGVDDATEGWYDTGDLVEVVDPEVQEFVFIGRDNELVNVGGLKANPLEIEQVLCLHPSISKARVWGKTNPVVGTILVAEVVTMNSCSEAELRAFLKENLQDYKIPRVISFVDNIDLTRSGKVKRI
ncbi:MAG: AMP-binding protein [Candidatus Cloacimonetes bacterium HGW-Cloacimonetes-2]|jgi:acyl-coenzyme A synthetase/AMP-(fatty) acid ligase|nr:MAG: AMP-binding protein [Candidatus Cloacimonetes bacterium HGW-Cloacimonetes-2]